MWFSLFAVVLILAMTFYQGLLGAFSAAINCVLTILAAALAFGLYEDVYFNYLIDRQPDEGRAIALMAIFIVSLLVMRIIVDLVIKDNMKLPVYVDRGVGGAIGFITAMITIGTFCVGVQLLPFPYQWLGFSRYALYNADDGSSLALKPSNDKETEEDVLCKVDVRKLKFVRNSLWLSPDAFAAGLASQLSANALTGGGPSLGQVNPDFLGDIWWTRFTTKGQKTTVAHKPDAIQVETCWALADDELLVLVQDKDDKAKQKLVEPGDADTKLPSGSRWLAVRVKLTNDATDDGGSCRFNTGQVRLVTNGKGGRTKSYHLVGINVPAEMLKTSPAKAKDLYYRLSTGETVACPAGRIDFVFEVPEDEDPWFVEFRSNARAKVPAAAKEAPDALTAPAKKDSGKKTDKTDGKKTGEESDGGTAKPDKGSSSSGKKTKPNINKHTNTDAGDEARSGGRTKRYSADEEGSFFGDETPFELTNYTANDIELTGGRVIGGGGRLTAKLDADDNPEKGSNQAITKFDVPQDRRLLQVSVRRLHPGSTLAQALDFARQIGNVKVKDEAGKEYPAVGTWGIATVNGERLFELVYFDQTTIIGSSAPPKLDIIRRDDMNKDYALYYLFHIPPGKKIVTFVTPKSSGEDLRSANLVAPE